MRRSLIAFGIFILSLPLVFSLWLLAAIKSPKLDHVTLHAPLALRQIVASSAMNNGIYGKASLPTVERVLRLDPDNIAALNRKCYVDSSEKMPDQLADCQKALSHEASASNYFYIGQAQLKQGDFCTAENNFTEAASKSSGSDNAWYLSQMGVAAIRCHDLPAARAALEASLDQDQKSLAEPNQDQDELDEDKDNILNDQEGLIIVYQQQHEKTLETTMCKAAHPDKAHCTCSLDKDNKPTCDE